MKKREVSMAESDLLRNTAAKHHDDQRGAAAHDVHTDEDNVHLPESTHDGEEHEEHHEDDMRQKGKMA
jgi:hypothetical protein